MGTFLFLVAIILFVLGIVFLILSIKNKTSKKRGIILIIIAILCLIIGYISDVATGNFVPDEQTQQTVTAPEEQQEVVESEPEQTKPEEQTVVEEEPTTEEIEQQEKDASVDVSYEDLARNPDSMTGQMVHMTAHITYIYGDVHDSVGCSAGMTYDETFEMWNDEIYLLVPYDDGTRVLEDDVIEIWGTYEGLSNNTDFMVSTNSAPYIEVKYWNFVE